MTNVIIAFSKMEDAKNIKSVLVRSGLNVVAACSSGAYAINVADSFDSGIVVCGYKLADMMYTELKECLPKGFDMLLIASERHWLECENTGVVFLPMPLKVHSLIDTLKMMVETTARQHRRNVKPRERSEEDKNIILTAKRLLMEKHSMTEEEAHHYMQKCSMDSGNSLVETAEMVMSFYG